MCLLMGSVTWRKGEKMAEKGKFFAREENIKMWLNDTVEYIYGNCPHEFDIRAHASMDELPTYELTLKGIPPFWQKDGGK